ncbi:MAG: metal-dependent hydrolase [Candidatus Hodarchaeales archaeon]|jgi:membrane-bound metal-dependent hydrolase YbcI (DUF457 family)
MDTETHILFGIVIGGLLGVIISVYQSDVTVMNIIFSTCFGGIGGIIPDKLEPATSWNHRQLFHSQRIFVVLSLTLSLACIMTILSFSDWIIFSLLGIIAGYLSHLFLDALTPVHLPR